MTNYSLIAFLVLAFLNKTYAQQNSKPKLIVGIVVDQMRAEYLYRFEANFTQKGFNFLRKNGFNQKNTHYNYIPTETGPGHATIYTGTTPANHGIVSNNWYESESGNTHYCVADSSVYTVGGSKKWFADNRPISASPRKLLATTFSDELKLFNNKRSMVIGVSLKDRAAILPVGHLADYAFWFNEDEGGFISSTYYSDQLPYYLRTFNKKRMSDSLLNSVWRPILPNENYINSNPDDSEYEKIYKGRENAVFPYDLKRLKEENGGYSLLMKTPFGNTLLTELAKTVIKEESLGQNGNIDFISISYSSTDKIGHDFGIRSMELEDTYIRLDRDIGELIGFLNDEIGKENYLLFLTSDHAASDNPNFLKESKIPSGNYDPKVLSTELNEKLSTEFGTYKYITFMDNTQIYIDEGNEDKQVILSRIEEYLYHYEGVKEVYVTSRISEEITSREKDLFIENSYNRRRSGDVYVVYNTGWMQNWGYGTTHATLYNNDTHVPMLWYGWNIKIGESTEVYSTTQIVPTLSMLLNVPLPGMAEKKPMAELFDK